MDAGNRVLAGDLLVAASAALVAGVAVGGAPLTGTLWWLGGLAGALTVVGLFAGEHGLLSGLPARSVVGLTLALALVFGGAFLALDAAPRLVLGAELGGVAAGLTAYRLLYGVVYPVPRRRRGRRGPSA